jgi:hypothetical protein
VFEIRDEDTVEYFLQGQEIFLYFIASRPTLGLIQPRKQWVTGSLPEGLILPGREADYSPPSSAAVKTYTPPYVFMA